MRASVAGPVAGAHPPGSAGSGRPAESAAADRPCGARARSAPELCGTERDQANELGGRQERIGEGRAAVEGERGGDPALDLGDDESSGGDLLAVEGGEPLERRCVDGPREADDELASGGDGRYVLIVPADHPVASRERPPSLREIAELPLIGYYPICRATHRAEARLREAHPEPNFVFRSADNGTVQGLVGVGVGAAIVPLLAVEPNDERIRVLELPRIPPRPIAIAWHRDRYRSPAAGGFVETARAVCGRLAQGHLVAAAAAAR